MLTHLHIENVAIIESSEITFGSGLNLLTGETGAGKSIIIDALGAIVGLRTSREVVRTGAAAARISAVFEGIGADVSNFLEQSGFVPEEDGTLLITREVNSDGRGVCRVNGRIATVSMLRELGMMLLQIHGQHDSLALTDEQKHRALLDRFGVEDALLAAYHEAYQALKAREREERALLERDRDRTRLMEEWQRLIEDVEAVAPTPDEEAELNARRRVLLNLETITSALDIATAAFLGDDEMDGALSLLAQAGERLSRVSEYDEDIGVVFDKLKELTYNAEDVSSDLGRLRAGYDNDPGELAEIEERLDAIELLKRRYACDVPALLVRAEQARTGLDEMAFSELAIEKARAACRAALVQAETLAGQLSQARREAGQRFTERMHAELGDLDMGRVVFEVEVSTLETREALRETGRDEVRFLISTNIGETPRPIAKIASGGELSRIMLALLTVLSQTELVGTLVFDEIDAGVSGRAATHVAEKLQRASQQRQVLCVTHLPQMAAMADGHYKIEKATVGERTVTGVTLLSHEGRVDELCRLIGGRTITESTRASAAELISACDAYKRQG